MNRRMFVLASSHMDREWYLPLGGNRVLFLKLFDRVFELLEKLPDFKFYTDGQTAVLEDYLKARPDRREEVKRYVREGRLLPGPWFVQSDERIPAGESLIRNLLIGRKTCGELGGGMKCGYVPDSFGHISQLPQILNGFGIDTAFMMRGPERDKTGRDFIWTGQNGSRVIAMSTEYSKSSTADWEGQLWNGIGTADTPRELERCLKEAENEKNAVAPCDLFIMGGDGQTLPANLGELGLSCSDTLDGVFDFLRLYDDRFRAVSGELNGSGDIKTLQDTLASRIYLKTENARAQTELNRAELLAAIASPSDKSRQGVLRLAWKLLVECHTHDGITGCHCDRTADEIENRLKRCESVAEEISDLALEELALRTDTSFAEDGALCVFHSAPRESSLTVPFTVTVNAKKALASLRLIDAKGWDVPLVVTSRETVGTIRSNNRAQQMFRHVVRFGGWARLNDLPAAGMKAYRVTNADSEPVYDLLTATENKIVTPFIELEITGSCLRLTDRRTGRVYENLNALTGVKNAGDCYTLTAEGEETEIPCAGRLLYNNGAFAAFEFTGEDVKWRCEASAFDPLLRFSLEIDNKTEDRAVFTSFDTCGGTPFRDQPFALEKGLYGVQPTSSFAGFEKDGQGLAVLHRGIHRADFKENGRLSLTLLSCQGRLYAHFFPDDRNEDFRGCEVLRRVSHSYAVLPLAGGEDLFTTARDFADGVACFDTEPHTGPLGDTWSHMRLEGAVQTAVKASEDGRRTLIRMFNPTDEPATARLTLPAGAKKAVKLTLAEEEIGPVDVSGFTLGGGEIATIGFEYGEEPRK